MEKKNKSSVNTNNNDNNDNSISSYSNNDGNNNNNNNNNNKNKSNAPSYTVEIEGEKNMIREYNEELKNVELKKEEQSISEKKGGLNENGQSETSEPNTEYNFDDVESEKLDDELKKYQKIIDAIIAEKNKRRLKKKFKDEE